MTTLKKCPGLKSKSGFKWWIPFGKNTDEMTLCDECRDLEEDYTLSDVLYSCNCDGFLLKNKASNGIFNVSFWYDENTKFHPVHTSYVVNSKATGGLTYDLVVPENGRFTIFIDSELKKNQYFKYEIYLDDECLYESAIYHKKSVMDETIFRVVNIPVDCFRLLKGKPFIIDNIILSVKINVYTFEPSTVDHASNEYYGDYTVINPKTLGVKLNATPSNFVNMIKPDYKFNQPLINQGLMKLFTVKPIVMHFRPCVQSSLMLSVIPDDIKSNILQEKIRLEKELNGVQREHFDGLQKIVDLEATILSIKTKLEKCSIYGL
jgi:hypothetical protein